MTITLTESIGSNQSMILVDNPEETSLDDVLKIEDEYVTVRGRPSASGQLLLGRGVLGSSRASHAAGSELSSAAVGAGGSPMNVANFQGSTLGVKASGRFHLSPDDFTGDAGVHVGDDDRDLVVEVSGLYVIQIYVNARAHSSDPITAVDVALHHDTQGQTAERDWFFGVSDPLNGFSEDIGYETQLNLTWPLSAGDVLSFEVETVYAGDFSAMRLSVAVDVIQLYAF